MAICGPAPRAWDSVFPPLSLYEPEMDVVTRFDQADCSCPEYTPPPELLQQI